MNEAMGKQRKNIKQNASICQNQTTNRASNNK